MPPALPMRDHDWPEPRLTPNAVHLSGYIGGVIDRDAKDEGGRYRLEQLGFPMIVKNTVTGARYRVTVEQISGEE